MTTKQRLINYALLMRFDKPIGIYLLMWPTLWALWIAGKGHPDADITLIFLAGVIMMRAAGCIINDFADRKIDDQVSRTKDRPMATGAVKTAEAMILFTLLLLSAGFLVLFTNFMTFSLAVAALGLAIIYPFMKRYTYMPQAFLGLAFGWAVPMAFAALTENVPPTAWLLLTATVLWATAYDTLYAMVDREDDIKIGVKSTAILFGDADLAIIGTVQTTFLLTMVMIGNKLEMGFFYYFGITVAMLLAGYQIYISRRRTPEDCFRAFLNNNWLGAAIYIGIVLNYWAT